MNMDIQLKCLSNLPITVDGIEIKPKSLKDIMDFGYSLYNQYLSIFCFDKDKIGQSMGIEKMELSHYKYLCALALNENYNSFVLASLKYFIGIDIYSHESGILYYMLDEKSPIVLSEEKFDKIVYIIKVQNALIQDEEEEDYNPANDKAKALLEKRKKVREKLRKAKQKNGDDEDDLTLIELISVVSCNCQGLNIFNIWDLNLFQFNDQFNRMVLLDNYKINIRALLAGAKSEEVNIENWMKKIH